MRHGAVQSSSTAPSQKTKFNPSLCPCVLEKTRLSSRFDQCKGKGYVPKKMHLSKLNHLRFSLMLPFLIQFTQKPSLMFNRFELDQFHSQSYQGFFFPLLPLTTAQADLANKKKGLLKITTNSTNLKGKQFHLQIAFKDTRMQHVANNHGPQVWEVGSQDES